MIVVPWLTDSNRFRLASPQTFRTMVLGNVKYRLIFYDQIMVLNIFENSNNDDESSYIKVQSFIALTKNVQYVLFRFTKWLSLNTTRIIEEYI